MPGLCDQWDMSGKVREIAFNFLAFGSFQKKKKREREREIALTTYLKGILKSSSCFNTLKLPIKDFVTWKVK